MAERVGFEPTVAKSYTRFPGAPVRPLQHLSRNIKYGGEGGIRTHEALAHRFSRAAPSTTRSPLRVSIIISYENSIIRKEKANHLYIG